MGEEQVKKHPKNLSSDPASNGRANPTKRLETVANLPKRFESRRNRNVRFYRRKQGFLYRVCGINKKAEPDGTRLGRDTAESPAMQTATVSARVAPVNRHPDLFNSKEAAVYLGVDDETVALLVRMKQLAPHRVGRQHIYHRRDLDGFVARLFAHELDAQHACRVPSSDPGPLDVPACLASLLPRLTRYAFKAEHPPCVYFLIHRAKLVYVGQTRNVNVRMLRHLQLGNVFDGALYLPLAVEDLDKVEATMIAHYRPTRNGVLTNGRPSPAVLRKYGIRRGK